MSTTSCHIPTTSASDLVSDPCLFEKWAAHVNLNPAIQEELPEDPLFAPIRDIQRSSKCFPRWLADKNSAELAPVTARYGAQVDDMLTWLGQLEISTGDGSGLSGTDSSESDSLIQLHDRQDLDLHLAIGMILQASHHYKRITRHPDLPPNEAELRIGLDSLLNYIYSNVDGDSHIWHSVERPLKLPQTNLENISVQSVTPDAVDIISLPDHPAYRDSLTARKSLSCFHELEPSPSLFIIHCVADFKQNPAGQFQVLMGMVSGLYQRRLLGTTNQFVFGLIRRSVHFLQVVAAIWLESKIQVYEIGSYSLVSPFHIVQLYFVLREIEQLGSSYRGMECVSAFGRSWNGTKVTAATSNPATSNSKDTPSKVTSPSKSPTLIQRGTMGLQNIGNTSFMNSALQCLTHIPELEQYFLSGLYRHEINYDNPDGMQGQIANNFGALLHNLYPDHAQRTASRSSGRRSSPSFYAPHGFKQTIGRFAPAFVSGSEQDMRGFLGFLLGALHEDLNRVLEKPQVEKSKWPEEGGGREMEAKVAKETLDGYKQQNDSIVGDLFQGMYKSTLSCQECAKVAIAFDPFMYLTLPLRPTNLNTWRHTIHYVPWDPIKPSLAIDIEVPKDSSYRYLKKIFGRWFDVEPENLLAAEVWSHKFYKFYDDYMNLTELADKDTLLVYELPIPLKSFAKAPPPSSHAGRPFESGPSTPNSNPNVPPAPLLIPVFHTSIGQRNGCFGLPLLVALDPSEASSQEGIYRAVVERCDRWTRNRGDLWRRPGLKGSASLLKGDIETEGVVVEPREDLFDLKLYNSPTMTGIETGFNMNPTTARFVDWATRTTARAGQGVNSEDGRTGALAQPLLKPTDALVCTWSPSSQNHFFSPDTSLFECWERYVHLEVDALRVAQIKSRSGKRSIDIENCVYEFTKEEQLPEGNLWYCPRCKKLQQATKKLELWSVPEILIVHLNRFSDTGAIRDNGDIPVEFPILGLDLAQHVRGGDPNECVYDLFAVDKRMDDGRCRAYVRNPADEEWYNFDDDSVSKSTVDELVNPNAHLLFYRRRSAAPSATIERIRARIGLVQNS